MDNRLVAWSRPQTKTTEIWPVTPVAVESNWFGVGSRCCGRTMKCFRSALFNPCRVLWGLSNKFPSSGSWFTNSSKKEKLATVGFKFNVKKSGPPYPRNLVERVERDQIITVKRLHSWYIERSVETKCLRVRSDEGLTLETPALQSFYGDNLTFINLVWWPLFEFQFPTDARVVQHLPIDSVGVTNRLHWWVAYKARNVKNNRPFPSSLQFLFQSESKCEICVMVISSNFNMKKNRDLALSLALKWRLRWTRKWPIMCHFHFFTGRYTWTRRHFDCSDTAVQQLHRGVPVREIVRRGVPRFEA